MDNKKAILNISVSTISRLLVLLITLITRKVLIDNLGSEANGIYSLFSSVLGILSVAELGIGTAITFSMYKPIVEKNQDQISGLYFMYRKLYLYILLIIGILGLGVTPFVDKFAGQNSGDISINMNFLLYLISMILTYVYAHKSSLINAYKDTYYVTSIRSLGLIIEAVLQILTLYFFKSFELFIIAIFLSNVIQWLLTEYIFKKKYKQFINGNKGIDQKVKKDIFDKSKAMFYHKIGTVLVTTLSNIIVSVMISVSFLGYYTNYITIITGMISLLALLFTSITPIFGHLFAKDKEAFYSKFKEFYTLNIIIGFIFLMGFNSVIDNLVALIFGEQYILSNDIVFLITISYFLQFIRNSILSFRDASGTFYHDRFKPILEGILSLGLSLVLVKNYGIIGILIANIITKVVICHVIEPFVLYKYAFNKSVKSFYFYNYSMMIIFTLSMILQNTSLKSFDYSLVSLLIKGSLSVIMSLIVLSIMYIFIPRFKESSNGMLKLLKK